MEIVSSIIAAITAGVISSSKETASQAVKEAYASFKSFIASRIENISFSNIESDPNSDDTKTEIQQSLGEGKMSDLNLIYTQAINLLQEINKQDKETITSLNIILRDVDVGGNLKWNGGKSGIENSNFTAERVKVVNDLTIGE